MELIESQDFNIQTLLPSPLEVFELPVRMKLKLNESLERIKKATNYRVEDIMTKNVTDISPNTTIGEAARIMSKNNINRLPVIDNKGKLVGIVTRGDIVGAI
jgi:CBS domain-containing protein